MNWDETRFVKELQQQFDWISVAQDSETILLEHPAFTLSFSINDANGELTVYFFAVYTPQKGVGSTVLATVRRFCDEELHGSIQAEHVILDVIKWSE